MAALSKKELYSELGQNFRVNLRWRELLFGGFLTLSSALGVGLYTIIGKPEKLNAPSSLAQELAWVIPLTGALLAYSFLLLDRRCHEVILSHYELGGELEDGKGCYALAAKKGIQPAQVTHTAVLESIYKGALILFSMVAALLLLWGPLFAATSVTSEQRQGLISGADRLLRTVPGLILTFFGYRLLSPVFPNGIFRGDNTFRHIAGGTVGLLGILLVFDAVGFVPFFSIATCVIFVIGATVGVLGTLFIRRTH